MSKESSFVSNILLKVNLIDNLNKGLNQLHKTFVIHRDLTPANILFSDTG
jgi:serine/threonine protein kinase